MAKAKLRTEEEKVARYLAKIVNDLELDLDQVGMYLARNARNVSFRRLKEIVEAAEFEKAEALLVNDPNTLF